MSYGKGQHPNSKAALIPIKPGECRNPQGKNGVNLLPTLKKLLSREITVKDLQTKLKVKVTVAQALNLVLVKKGLRGDRESIQFIYSHIEGLARRPADGQDQDELITRVIALANNGNGNGEKKADVTITEGQISIKRTRVEVV